MPSQNHSERDPVYCTKRMIGDERIAFCLVGNILQTFDNDLDIKIVKTVSTEFNSCISFLQKAVYKRLMYQLLEETEHKTRYISGFLARTTADNSIQINSLYC